MPREIRFSFIKDLFLAGLSGVLLGLSFPSFDYHLLSWIAFIPLLAISADSVEARLRAGLFTGFISYLIIFWWIIPVFKIAQQPTSITLISLLALSGVLSLYVGIFKIFDGWVVHPFWKPFYLAAVWVVLEALRSFLLTGFPWALLGHTQYSCISFIQIASVTGVAGISFFLILFQSWIVNLWVRKFKFRSFDIVVPVLLVLVLVWGNARVKSFQSHEIKTIRVALLQGNIDQYQKWDDRYESDIRLQYHSLAKMAALEKPDVMIWPETAVPGWIPNDHFYMAWVTSIATETKIPQLVGAISQDNSGDYNAAFLFSSSGSMVSSYKKQHLVPFGEYVPLAPILTHVTPYLGQLGKFEAGREPGKMIVNRVLLSPTICYEMIFPGLVRRSALAGADILVNVTNDGWYLKTGAPLQHFVTNIFRAVETGRPVVRAANTGISGLIDPLGHVLNKTSLMTATADVIDVPLYEQPITTPFMKWGNWFSWLCLFLVVTILAACPANSKTKLKN